MTKKIVGVVVSCLVTAASAPAFAATAAAAPSATAAGTGTPRPSGHSLGIGMGFEGQINVFAPTTAASARIRLNAKTTLEPGISIQFASQRQHDVGTNTAKEWGGAFDVNLRRVCASRDRADFVGILGAGLAANTEHTTQVTPAERISTQSAFGQWGVGVELWPGAHWSIGADVTNPFITFASSQTTSPGAPKVTSTTVTGGFVFEPEVRAMTHLYF